MDELQKLYEALSSRGYYTKTFDEFKVQFQDPAYQDKVFGVVSRDGLFTKSKDEFLTKFKTGQPSAAPVVSDKKKVDTELPSEDGSLVLPKIEPQRAVAESTIQKPRMIAPLTEEDKKKESEQGWLMNTVSAIDRGFWKNFIGSPIKGLGTVIEKGTEYMTLGKVKKGPISDALIKFGDYFNNTIDELAPQDESFKNSLTDQFAQAFGQVVSYATTAGAGLAAKGAGATLGLVGEGAAATKAATAAIAAQAAPKAVTVGTAVKGLASELASPVAVSAGLTMGQSEFDRAKQMGATDDQAFEAFWKNAAVGSILEKIPVMQFMKRFNTASAGGLMNYIKTKGVGGITGGLEEMTTEVLQQIYANKTAQDIYNANQEIFEGVGTSGGIGFGVGFLLNAMGANAKLLRKEGRIEEAKVVEDQIKELETQAERGGPSSYSFNGIKIQPIQTESGIQEPRAIISNMIDNMNASDLSKANLEITNDPELKLKLQDKIVTSSIKEQAREANPNLSEEQLDQVTNLEKELRKLEGNTTQIGKDRSAEIRSQIKTIQQDAVQKQAAGEVPVQPTPGVSEKVEEGKPQPKPEDVTTEGIQEEIITPQVTQEELTPTVTRVKVAPFFNTQIASTAEAAQLRQSPEYKGYLESLSDIGRKIGIKVTPIESIGGYENQKGERIVEISNDVDLENATMEQAEEFAALAGALAPQVQEATIAAQYLNQEGGDDHKANEYTVVVSDVDGAIDALKAAGISDFSINEKTGEVSFIDVLDFTDPQLQENIGEFIIQLKSKGINYEQQVYKPLNSTRVGKARRKEILGRIKSAGARPVQGREDILPTLEEAVRRDAEFQGVAVDDYFKPRPGNRLFNKPLETVAEIADRYFQRVFGKPRPKYYGSRILDEARAKRISDAFDAMKHDPNNPEVKAAYEALAKETLDQYKAFTDAGYSVEINNTEPYNDSQEMIDDLRNNNRIKIFSTESGFGDTKITDQQRKENPLLRDSGFKDVNGKTLLINDVFRAIHDFYGHSELGNSFGPKGEENAWNVHARMFSPEARKAMTTETRGQNSYVNFSGVNDRITQLREQARALREEGLYAQARKKVEEIYDQMSFADQKVGLLPEEFYQIDETDFGDADRIPEAEVMEEISQELTEADLPGYDRMMGEIDGVIEKSQNRGVPFNKIMDNAMEYMKQSKAYENATDVQREALVRDLRSRFKKREKRAPSAKKILGDKKTEVTVDEMTALKDQIKLEARAAREAKTDLNTKRRQLADFVRKMAASGKIPANRVAALINRIGKVNLDSNESVERFVDYAGKLFADADYANKLSIANETKRQINKLSKNKEKFANLRDLGSKFVKIDPSMVDNIDEYNQVASLIKDSIKGSTTRGANTKFTNMIKESDAIDYINNTMQAQEKKLFDMKVDEVREIFGVDASNLTYNQLMEMIESKEPLTKDNEKLIRSAINKAFGIYSAVIDESIRTGKDLFTGQDIEYTSNQKKIVKEFMDMNLNLLRPKQALEAVDALMNFIQNKSIAKMESVVSKYKGDFNMDKLYKKGIRGRDIRKYWSKGLGRLLVEQTANIDFLFEREFGGFYKGGEVMDAMGLTDAINGKAKAQAQADRVIEEYVDKFYKQKPNGEAFNTSKNNTERGMVAFMSRTVIGNEAEMQAEFNRRKNLILKVNEDGTRSGSIVELEKGNEQEVKKAKLYQEVYDKILKDSNNIEEVQSKAAKENVDAVKFWQEKWSDKYDDLYDVALGVYNKILGKDMNFNPDRFTKLSSDPGKTELATEDMGFIVNSGNAPLYKKETGVLMAATRPEALPVNEDTGRTNRYIDLSFDSNNSNSYYDALVDINTAAPIRQMQSALNSEAFEKMVKNNDDRRLIRNRINLFVNNARKKNPYSNDEFSTAVKKLNRLTNIAVGQALGGVTQPIKQTIPIAMNTLINAGDLDVASVFNQAEQDFINKSGYAIANRGAESQAQVESLNKLIEEEAKNKGEKLLRGIEKLNKIWLKNTLVKFDLVIARASWMTYYKQALKKQGIDPSTIDFSTHEVNKEAADYAQRQVNRQQNVSDSDLAGALLSSKDPKMQLFVKILMPFSSFRMNQSARLGSDLATLMNKTATVDDKKIALRSLAGTSVETATFRALQAGILMLTAKFVKDYMGREDDEEKDKKKMDAIIKGQLTSVVADVFSPTPLADKLVQLGVSSVLEETQDALDVAKEDRLSIYSGNKQDVFQSLGLLGITGARAYQLIEMAKLSSGSPYEDDYGRKKYLSEEDRDAIGALIPFAIMASTGLAPAEVNSFIRTSLSDAKRAASTVEGGKTRGDVELEGRAESLSEERKAKLDESKQDKITALEQLKNDEIEEDKISVIDDMIEELSMSDEEKKAIQSERKREKVEKDEKMKELLQGYDNKTEMKRYDPELYEETFGENSEYYQENKAEMEVEKELNKKLQEMEDEERGYTPAQKRRLKYRNRLKSFKAKYKSESESKTKQ